MNHKFELLARMSSNRAKVGVVGLGYVGLPLALGFVEAGYSVIGFDVDESKLVDLVAGKSWISHISSERVSDAVGGGRLTGANTFEPVKELDAIILCLPTPLGVHQEPDLSFVVGSLEAMLTELHRGQVLILESTTYPGTTEEELRPRIESLGFEIGNDFFLAYSPEREDPGNPDFSTRSIPKVVGGCTASCLEVALATYGRVVDQLVPVSSTKAAEMTKLLENIHRAVNVGLVNEMKIAADALDIDIFEVIRAASTKPFGFVPYYPGPGLGGHCLPIDPYYLTWKAKEVGVQTRFIELAGEVNSTMPYRVIDKVVLALNAHSKSIRGSRILILGVAYKKNVGDTRESPALEIISELLSMGALVEFSDPYVNRLGKMRRHSLDLVSQQLSREMLGTFDLVILTTDHDKFDYELIQSAAIQVVDTRGKLKLLGNVVRA